ncbi:Chk1 protein kinase [Diatrype stigma]|uniref:histidine kinase n=1 Tax=Diatrype stigma TaxID=117547 RepID=A0AAN9UX63_9PEZI
MSLLSELPPASRAILAWAAILGSSFSFALICQLLSREFDYIYSDLGEPSMAYLHKSYSKEEAVAGLQAAVNSCIIVQGDTDERFRFAHDRYVQAASTLRTGDTSKMHFTVAQTLIKYEGTFSTTKDNIASHICEATDIIREKVSTRQLFRRHLVECAASATENGARSTATKYYSQALKLLQPDPWADGAEDVDYEETLKLHIRAAESYVYMGNHSAAYDLLGIIFHRAKTAEDKAPAWLLQSRLLAQNGDSQAALTTLKQSLIQLKVEYDPDPTFEKCDVRFMSLAPKIQSVDRAQLLLDPLENTDSQGEIIGAILAEAISAAWWSDCLDFYNLALTLVHLHMERGASPQSGVGFLHLAMVGLSRFNMVDFAAELGNQCVEYLDRTRDSFSLARGYMLYANFLSHIYVPIRVALNQAEQSIENAAAAGDRLSVILSFGLLAQMRFFASENLADLESICRYSCEEIPGWQQDTRGGTFLIAVRQVCRALQGKTNTGVATDVMSDDQHHSVTYKQFLDTKTRNGGRSILIYETMEIVPLYIYGHYEQACEVGRRCLDNSHLIWSARNTRLAMLFHGLALAGLMVRKLSDPRYKADDLKDDVQGTIEQLESLSKKMKAWQVVSDVNYLAWSKFLDAQLAELRGEHGVAIREYETALDHTAEHSFLFEEALGNFLMAGFFIRQSARRSATAVLKESVALWRQLGASGLAQRIEEEHALLLHGPIRNPRAADQGVQTDFAGDATSVTYAAAPDGDDIPHSVHQITAESRASRTAAWRGSMQPEAGAGLPALDMIDLHAILVSSQVISSVLQVDVLLKTMCDVILQTCGASVTQAAIIVQDEDAKSDEEWCIAASGDPERGATAHIPGHPLAGSSQVAENVILYCARFRDFVFLPDLLNDERFGNVSESWLQRNPLSKAVIAIPICHGVKPLLGVLYLEGEPGSFTDRNLTVLQLLVNQIGISYSNALSMKSIEKVSEQNNAMVEMQKRALAQAIEAQAKAKHAEAEANRNVKIAEEAAKAKSIFLANVSHELRTPLNGVIGNSELLRDSNLNKEQLEMAESIRVSADLLLTVINDILDFSKMEADKMKLYVIAFNPEEMVREVVRAVSYSNREKASKKNVKIIQDINLPPMLIYGDPIRLHQVLGNLIGNSLKFTEDGSITIGARIDADTPEKATLTFWVRDTGIGIPPKQLAKLFRPFSQADASTARKYGGSGLGLSICKSLIETMMKGRIELESEENVGTTAWFTVTFDKAKPEASAGDAQNTSPQVPDRTREALREATANPYLDLVGIPKEQVRICIAEDNLINQRIAINYMRKLGYTKVDAYENGLKAVEGLRQKAREGQPYQVVLMDVQMPVLDGYEATKLLRKDEIEVVRKVLVIAMTASAIQGDREKCLAAGMNDYLAKPVKADVLKRKLDTYTIGQVPVPHPLLREPHEHELPDKKPASASSQDTTPAPSPTTKTATAKETKEPTAPQNSAPLVAVRKDPPVPVPALQPTAAPDRDTRDANSSENPSIAQVMHSTLSSQQKEEHRLANGDRNHDKSGSRSLPAPSVPDNEPAEGSPTPTPSGSGETAGEPPK